MINNFLIPPLPTYSVHLLGWKSFPMRKVHVGRINKKKKKIAAASKFTCCLNKEPSFPKGD